ncbi:hypothetical protein LMT8_07660 [Leuconostoc mesenteroides subsp. cremoris TIFN8]|nr:hypothetical protein LMT8_07660 [Leuconostoc mesenteroides subsp. cremoris TIFN8]
MEQVARYVKPLRPNHYSVLALVQKKHILMTSALLP